jgi:hypothetical protein
MFVPSVLDSILYLTLRLWHDYSSTVLVYVIQCITISASLPFQSLLLIDSTWNNTKNSLQPPYYQSDHRIIVVQHILYDTIRNIDKALCLCHNLVLYPSTQSLTLFLKKYENLFESSPDKEETEEDSDCKRSLYQKWIKRSLMDLYF